jgi:outer membrane protein assembly factor BamD
MPQSIWPSSKTLLWSILSFGIVLILSISSCSQYDKLLKSNDLDLKYTKAKEYYNRGSYNRALPLLKQLLTLYKGTEKEEELMYFIAYSHYGQGEFLIASALFKNYYTFFPTTNKTAECSYMSAYALFLASPKESLDQTTTYKSIDAFQLFINRFPASDSVEAANGMIDRMRRKLESKAMESADLYYHTRNYKAAAVAYENLLQDYPDIPDAEYVNFLIVKSYSELADRSVVCKQEERYASAQNAFQSFKSRFPESSYLDQAQTLSERAGRLKNVSAEDCAEQERLRLLLKAEGALRNKKYEQAVNSYNRYKVKYAGRDDLDKIQLDLVKARVKLAEESNDACEAKNLYKLALDDYYPFTGEFSKSEYLSQAEKLYDEILRSQDRATKDCEQ